VVRGWMEFMPDGDMMNNFVLLSQLLRPLGPEDTTFVLFRSDHICNERATTPWQSCAYPAHIPHYIMANRCVFASDCPFSRKVCYAHQELDRMLTFTSYFIFVISIIAVNVSLGMDECVCACVGSFVSFVISQYSFSSGIGCG